MPANIVTTYAEYTAERVRSQMERAHRIQESMGDITPAKWLQMHPDDESVRQHFFPNFCQPPAEVYQEPETVRHVQAPDPNACAPSADRSVIGGLLPPQYNMETQLALRIQDIMNEELGVSEKNYNGLQETYAKFHTCQQEMPTLLELIREHKPGTRLSLIAELAYDKYVRPKLNTDPLKNG